MGDRYERQREFWEHAGQVGYGNAMFSNPTVEQHIVASQWHALAETADLLGLGSDARVIELGCGDGSFTEAVLSPRFRHIDAFDASVAAIKRARKGSRAGNISFHVADLAVHEFAAGDRWDAAFLKGFLHHVKPFAPDVIGRLAAVCPRIVLLEPNGGNLIRKLLELTPAYTRAGEQSFRLSEIIRMFERHGYRAKAVRRINLVPPFLPVSLFPLLRRIEAAVERSSFLNRLCATCVIGLERDDMERR